MHLLKRGKVRPAHKNQQQTAEAIPDATAKLPGATPCMKTAQPSARVLQDTADECSSGLAKTPPIPIPVSPKKNDDTTYVSQSASDSEEADEPAGLRSKNPLSAVFSAQPDMLSVLQICCDLSPRAQQSDVNDTIAQLTLLVQKGVSLHTRDRQSGRTALHWACIKGHPEIVLFLCDAGAKQDINLRDTDGKTALHYVLEAHFSNGRAELLRFLLEQGADLSLLQDQGASLVYAHYMTPELALLLKERGLDFDSKSKFAETPLMIACDKQNAALVKFLLEQNVNPKMTGALGRTCLHNGKLTVQIAQWLIYAGAKVNAANDLGETPLMLACEAGNLPLATMLLQHGASPLAVSASGKGVLDYAKKAGGAIAGGFVLLTQQGAGCRSVQD